MRAIWGAAVAASLLFSAPATARKAKSNSSSSSKKSSGPVCKKGKPCGNSCIARNKVCHVGPGTARSADEEKPPVDKDH